jgi:outer membrane protein OmpA-like peptidoglycan-associated protein
MIRSEVRTAEAWRRYDGAVLIIALLGLLTLLLLWWLGNGPTREGCCAGPIAATATALQTTKPAPAPASIATPPPEPVQTEPKLAAAAPLPERAKAELPKTPLAPTATLGGDCNALVAGVLVHFAFDSATLSQETRATLDKAIDCRKDGRYQVAGHADNVGSSAINQRVSVARARAVFEYLRSMGVDATRLSAIGFGDTRPIADNTTAEGRAQNRRVALTRLPQGARSG